MKATRGEPPKAIRGEPLEAATGALKNRAATAVRSSHMMAAVAIVVLECTIQTRRLGLSRSSRCFIKARIGTIQKQQEVLTQPGDLLAVTTVVAVLQGGDISVLPV